MEVNQSASAKGDVFQFVIPVTIANTQYEPHFKQFDLFGNSIKTDDEKTQLQKVLDDYLGGLLRDKSKIPLEIILSDTSLEDEFPLSRIPLPEIFTKLNVTYIGSTKQTKGEKSGKKDAIQALAENKHIVILGNPGAGKTTLLNYIAVIMASILKTKDLRMINKLLHDSNNTWSEFAYPIHVNIRSFAASTEFISGESNASSLVNYVIKKLKGRYAHSSEIVSQYVNSMLDQGMMLIVLDGLDHLPGEIRGIEPKNNRRAKDREKLKSILLDFVRDEKLANNRVVVTSRSYAYRKNSDWHLGNEFSVAELLPFDEAQIKQYIQYWLMQLDELRASGDSRHVRVSQEDINRFATQYLNQILANEHSFSLAKSPLVLTFLVSQFGSKINGQKRFPVASRFELFESVIKMLANRWSVRVESGEPENSKPEPLHERLNLESYELFEKFLAIVALEGQKLLDNTASMRASYITESVIRTSWQKIKRAHNITGEPVEEVWEEIHRRSGILMPSRSEVVGDSGQEEEIFDFPHQSLQETLSAKAILDKTPELIGLDYWPADLHGKDNLEISDLIEGLIRKNWERWQVVISLALESLSTNSLADMRRVVRKLLDLPIPVNEKDSTRWYGCLILGKFCADGFVNAKGDLHFDILVTWLEEGLMAQVLSAEERLKMSRYLGALGDKRTGLHLTEFNLKNSVHDVINNPFWVNVRAGEISIGTPPFDSHQKSNERRPEMFRARVNHFVISKHPVTNALFESFLELGYGNPKMWEWSKSAHHWFKHRRPQQRHLNGEINAPVTNITWYEAVSFCKWLTSGYEGRIVFSLPSEKQWLLAAGGGNDTVYAGTNNMEEALSRVNLKPEPCNIGIFPDNLVGLGDIVTNNVREWTSSIWSESLTIKALEKNGLHHANPTERCVKGTSFNDYLPRLGRRSSMSSDSADTDVGFRIIAKIKEKDER